MKVSKKEIIIELRKLGIKATYKNICWVRSKMTNNIVGGIIFYLKCPDVYFITLNGSVELVSDHSGIEPYVYKD